MTEFCNWPWQYNFPPFFTIQVNQDTLKHQLSTWRSLVVEYMKAHKQCILDVRDAGKSQLFNNAAISRQMPQDGILIIMKDLWRTGLAEPIDKTQLRWYVFWEPLDQIASALHKWAIDNGMTNTVCTLFELSNGDSCAGHAFHGLDEEVMVKAIKKLEVDQKAEVFEFDNSRGVKFF